MNTQSSETTTPVSVIRLIEDLDSGSFEIDLKFRSVKGIDSSLQVPRALIQRPSEIFKALLDAGAELPLDQKSTMDLLLKELANPPGEITGYTRRAGWRGDTYIGKVRSFGSNNETMRFRPSGTIDPGYGLRSGDHVTWSSGLKIACEASSFFTFALCLGFGGSLLSMLDNDEGAIFNVFGSSSSGKSLMARALASVAGRAERTDLETYDITDRGVEELCFARNDWAAVFDEEGRAKGGKAQRRERVRSIAFMVPGGRGMTRSEQVASVFHLPNHTWRLFAMSSGEKPLEDASNRRAAGEQVRHIDIGVPDIKEAGIFDRLTGSRFDRVRKATEIAGTVEATIKQHYGVAQDIFLEALVKDHKNLTPKIGQLVERFVNEVGANDNAWERRLATKFGIVAAGGVLAAKFDVAPFSQRHVWECAQSVYQAARRSVFTVEESANKVLDQLRAALQDEHLLPRLDKGEVLPVELREKAWGFRRRDAKDGEVVAILPARFERLVGSRSAATAIMSSLLARGVTIKSSDGKAHRQMAVQGFSQGRTRWVCLRRSML
ncbi:MAG: DUF927 domain-containing protein [Janthinobacterium lividum]